MFAGTAHAQVFKPRGGKTTTTSTSTTTKTDSKSTDSKSSREDHVLRRQVADKSDADKPTKKTTAAASKKSTRATGTTARHVTPKSTKKTSRAAKDGGRPEDLDAGPGYQGRRSGLRRDHGRRRRLRRRLVNGRCPQVQVGYSRLRRGDLSDAESARERLQKIASLIATCVFPNHGSIPSPGGAACRGRPARGATPPTAPPPASSRLTVRAKPNRRRPGSLWSRLPQARRDRRTRAAARCGARCPR